MSYRPDANTANSVKVLKE